MGIVIIVGLILFIIAGGCSLAYKNELKSFNNGVCPNCGTKLRHFDDDSQGGQGWRCDNCSYITWISWFKR